MNKLTKKRNKALNRDVVARLVKKYGVSKRYITMSVKGDRTSETSELIKDEYKKLVKEIEKALNK